MFDIKEELKKLPEKPGVYIMKDKDDKILYVGKAVILKNRVRQYFQKNNKTARIEKMVSLIDHFEYIVVDSEMEALILECNLIKLHRPKYNVLLKDDKMYPYIKLTINEEFPTLRVTRKKLNDTAKYYGPYTNAFAVKDTVDFLNQLFMLKHCRKIFKKPETPCLNYHIKRCMGVCSGNVSREEYMKSIRKVMMFLDGKVDDILKDLETEMKQAAKEVLNELKINIPIYGLVKNDKHRTRGIIDENRVEFEIHDDEVMHFITFMQDEVHNTAIEYHRKLREKRTSKSILDEIPGIGEKRKAELLKKFKTVNNILNASVEELEAVDGIDKKTAREIFEFIH